VYRSRILHERARRASRTDNVTVAATFFHSALKSPQRPFLLFFLSSRRLQQEHPTWRKRRIGLGKMVDDFFYSSDAGHDPRQFRSHPKTPAPARSSAICSTGTMDLLAGPARKWLRMSNTARSSGQTRWSRHTVSEKSATSSVRLTPRAHPSVLQNHDLVARLERGRVPKVQLLARLPSLFFFLYFWFSFSFILFSFLFLNPNLNLKSVVNLSSFKCTTEYTS
jgi:hypothetical protein